MAPPQIPILLLQLLFLFSGLIPICSGELGRAAHYDPPYRPTACYGNDVSEFPTSNLFAAAGEAVWDNGAACGSQYLVRCISAQAPGVCKAGQTIRVKIVDRAETSASTPSRDGAVLVLSTTAFGAIASHAPASVGVEFARA